jgi:hypothetical protein
VLGAATGAAAAFSTAAVGIIVQHFGDFAGFASMATAILVGTALRWLCLPETKPEKYVD